jgi:hypothetical protein
MGRNHSLTARNGPGIPSFTWPDRSLISESSRSVYKVACGPICTPFAPCAPNDAACQAWNFEISGSLISQACSVVSTPTFVHDVLRGELNTPSEVIGNPVSSDESDRWVQKAVCEAVKGDIGVSPRRDDQAV